MTRTTIINTKSIMNAPARLPAEPSSRRRSTPSGVTKVRLRSRVLSALVATLAAPRRPGIEICQPADQDCSADQGAETVTGDRLPSHAFQETRDAEHDHRSAHGGRGGSPGIRHRIHSRRAPGEGDRHSNPNPGRSGNANGEDLGCSMNHEPGDDVWAEALHVEHREESAKHQPVV